MFDCSHSSCEIGLKVCSFERVITFYTATFQKKSRFTPFASYQKSLGEATRFSSAGRPERTQNEKQRVASYAVRVFIIGRIHFMHTWLKEMFSLSTTVSFGYKYCMQDTFARARTRLGQACSRR